MLVLKVGAVVLAYVVLLVVTTIGLRGVMAGNARRSLCPWRRS